MKLTELKMIKTADKQLEIYPGCHWCADNVGKIAFWGNLGLFFLKLACGIEGNSKALVADAVHSGVDVLTALVVMICLHVSKAPPDEEHPYGHGNTEYVASVFIGISLVCVTGLILYDALGDIVQGATHQPTMIALAGLLVSIAGNELMFRHSYCCGTRFRSPAMIANAWENRADVYSSLAALFGVVCAQLGFLAMDSVGAILVAILIGRSAFEMLRTAWNGILDHSIDESIEERIHKEVSTHTEVQKVASLRTREVGQYLAIDLKLAVSPNLTLREAHEISMRVKDALIKEIDHKVGMINVSPTGFYEKG